MFCHLASVWQERESWCHNPPQETTGLSLSLCMVCIYIYVYSTLCIVYIHNTILCNDIHLWIHTLSYRVCVYVRIYKYIYIHLMYHIKIPRMVLQVLLVARWAVPSDRLHRTESTDEFDDCIDYDPTDPGTQVLAFLFCSPFHIFCSSSSSSPTLSYIILPLPHTVWVSCLMFWFGELWHNGHGQELDSLLKKHGGLSPIMRNDDISWWPAAV